MHLFLQQNVDLTRYNFLLKSILKHKRDFRRFQTWNRMTWIRITWNKITSNSKLPELPLNKSTSGFSARNLIIHSPLFFITNFQSLDIKNAIQIGRFSITNKIELKTFNPTPHWPNFSVMRSESFIIQVRFSSLILNIKF